jgi:HD superfamily phosphohydrolase
MELKERIIKYCIYGYITVPLLCGAFIDNPYFQRLRRVKQLGNAFRVYPSATHTRFEHSIGVMHLAGVMCNQLKISDNRLINLIQLAGLYHDVGHLPYSHLFDRILEELKPDTISHHHEERSVLTFLKVSKGLNLLTEGEEKFVCACIKGEFLEGHDPYLFQIISSEVDVDKLDYLCRDAYHTGMPSFQANYIILNVRIDNNKRLAFRTKASEDIKNLFETRNRMHELVYQHPVSSQYDTMYMCMLLKIGKEIDFNEMCDYKLDTLLMTHEKTKHIYSSLERRIKNHDDLCSDKSHPIITKHIVQSGTLNDIVWVSK